MRLSFEIAELDEVTTWILGFGSLAKVIAPDELQNRVASELERALDRYRR